ncbi:hypothetical protein [Streptomyces sp. H27-H5]|uniref:hypothetical protein n=1 Tax=Streptomyces sp. H27-H5 TaxID=2996460 RepID=UPI0022717AEF|nr:hypothetical protein [Streptomyces sp. H27-H5]MCY0956225.1 hypothetical protein [Streptomyces sp. H27-H5]
MYLVYQPEGSDEPKRWKYNPRKLMSAEREMLERRTGLPFTEFSQDVLRGNSVCRRALLFMYLKRDHPGVKYDDVDFAWDELELEYSRSELELMRAEAAERATGEERAAALAHFDAEIETAFDDTEDEGKAGLPVVG